MTDEITPATSDASHGERKKGPIGRVVQFVREVIIELRKVVTPTRKELITYTSVVLAFVVIMMAIIGVLDVAIGILIGFILGNGELTLPWAG